MMRVSSSPRTPSLRLLVTTLLLLTSGAAGERTYTDSKGDIFTVEDKAAPPKIVVNANGALSLFHLGLPSSQLKAVYDHWVLRGSTLDLEDPSGEYDSEFRVDPNEEEIAFLQQATNLSPSCTENSGGCLHDFTPEDLGSLEGDYDFIVLIRAGVGTLDTKQNDLGERIIWIDYKYEHNTGCYGTTESMDAITNEEKCYSMSLIDVVMKLEEFADFLGVVPTETVQKEKQAMCEAAANFVEHSKDLHDRGIYAAAISMRPFNGITMNWFPPITYPWLRTLEELGFPLLHPPNTTQASDLYTTAAADWFVNCNVDDYPFCEDTTGAMPIDLWLMDSRTYATTDASYDDSLIMFPDKAFAARQYTYWQFNDGAISYTNIARYLNDITASTSNVQRLHNDTDTIACAENLDVTSSEFTNRVSGGLSSVPGSGTYACRGNLQTLYTECPLNEPPRAPTTVLPSNTPTDDDDVDVDAPNTGTSPISISASSGIRLAGASMTKALVLSIAGVTSWLFLLYDH